MRARVLLGGATLAIVLLTSPVGVVPAFAAGKEAAECIEKLEAGKKVDDCHDAPSPILPETNEIIWGGISFLIVAFALSKFLVPAIQKSMAARTQRIVGDLEAADNSKTEAQKMLAEYQAQLANAKGEANRIIEDARQQAESVRKELIAKAEADSADVRAKATADLNAQADRIKSDLTAHVKTLSLELAERVVGANLNNETNAALVDRYIAELGAK